MVERGSEKPEVAGSLPALSTCGNDRLAGSWRTASLRWVRLVVAAPAQHGNVYPGPLWRGRPRIPPPGDTRRGRSVLGALAHLGERLPCKQEVAGSTPAGSTRGSSSGGRRVGSSTAPRQLARGTPVALAVWRGVARPGCTGGARGACHRASPRRRSSGGGKRRKLWLVHVGIIPHSPTFIKKGGGPCIVPNTEARSARRTTSAGDLQVRLEEGSSRVSSVPTTRGTRAAASRRAKHQDRHQPRRAPEGRVASRSRRGRSPRYPPGRSTGACPSSPGAAFVAARLGP